MEAIEAIEAIGSYGAIEAIEAIDAIETMGTTETIFRFLSSFPIKLFIFACGNYFHLKTSNKEDVLSYKTCSCLASPLEVFSWLWCTVPLGLPFYPLCG